MAFYKDVLGMPLIRSWDSNAMRGAMLDSGAGIVEVVSNGTDSPGAGCIRHLAFATDDVDACASAVRSAGYEITIEPVNREIASNPPYPIRICFCIGPLGEEIEFFQEL